MLVTFTSPYPSLSPQTFCGGFGGTVVAGSGLYPRCWSTPPPPSTPTLGQAEGMGVLLQYVALSLVLSLGDSFAVNASLARKGIEDWMVKQKYFGSSGGSSTGLLQGCQHRAVCRLSSTRVCQCLSCSNSPTPPSLFKH